LIEFKPEGRIMISTYGTIPSEKTKNIGKPKKTVSEPLERKRKLGQYAVIWDGQKPVQSGAYALASKGMHIERLKNNNFRNLKDFEIIFARTGQAPEGSFEEPLEFRGFIL